ncbi:uncharacterized protein [Onthophagus taurus]|uniref:uncharacterized protein n=1 Tax=Onthophagus taurus TaxID=166361 RepID=UPI000C2046A8|nr:myc protein-like [Onthophagus taurus]
MDASLVEVARSYGFYDSIADDLDIIDPCYLTDDDGRADDLLDQLLEANDAILEGLKKHFIMENNIRSCEISSGGIPNDAVDRHRHDCMLMGYCVDNQHGTIDKRTMPEWLVTVREMNNKPPTTPPTNYYNKASLLKSKQQPQQQQQPESLLTTSESKDLITKPKNSPGLMMSPEKKRQQQQRDMPPCLGRLVQHVCNPLEDSSCFQTNIDAELSDYLSGTETIEDLYEAVMVNEVYNNSEESQEDSLESDESDEEEEEELEEEEECDEDPPEVHYDHSYHKNCFGPPPPTSSFGGIVTPSDSEEEIDVVSITEKHIRGRPLPTNPSTSDRQSIQRALVTAYANKQRYTPASTSRPSSPIYEPTTVISRRIHHQNHHSFSKRIRSDVGNNQRRGRKARRGLDSDMEPSQKRKLHNHMERKRRIDLATAFSSLKKVVPKIEKKDKASKINILKEAADYCHFLTNKSLVQQREKLRLQAETHSLEQRLRQLRNSRCFQ